MNNHMAQQSNICRWHFFVLVVSVSLLALFTISAARSSGFHLEQPSLARPEINTSLKQPSNPISNDKEQTEERSSRRDLQDAGSGPDVGIEPKTGESAEIVVPINEEDIKNMVRGTLEKVLQSSLLSSYDQLLNRTAVYPGALPDVEEAVVICMIVKNQLNDLDEFLVHHYHHLGIRRFYVMDDGSIPALSNYQDYSIPRDAITFIYFAAPEREGGGKMQYHAYNECSARFGYKHKWMGFIDTDEYVELVESPGKSMAQFLNDYEPYGALGISWQTHNSNGMREKSTVGNRKAYTSCIWDGEGSDNQHVKAFVQMKYYVGATTPHSFKLNSSMSTVGENFDGIDWAFRHPITRNKISLHHYGVKSRADYEEKMLRGSPTDHRKDNAWWDSIENQPKVLCNSLAIYHP